jgi:hypothetical protein
MLIVTNLLGPRQDRRTKEGHKRRPLRRDALVASARRDPLVGSARRDPLVGSAALFLIIRPRFTGKTSAPLQFRRSEGPACRVRGATLHDPSRFSGHDERAPPIPPLGGTRLSGPQRYVA